jgi:hypothetical protein
MSGYLNQQFFHIGNQPPSLVSAILGKIRILGFLGGGDDAPACLPQMPRANRARLERVFSGHSAVGFAPSSRAKFQQLAARRMAP